MIAHLLSLSFSRHVIAAVHFNHNLHRGVTLNEDGSERVKVVYPKFKNGNAKVQHVRVNLNYGKITIIVKLEINMKVIFYIFCSW